MIMKMINTIIIIMENNNTKINIKNNIIKNTNTNINNNTNKNIRIL